MTPQDRSAGRGQLEELTEYVAELVHADTGRANPMQRTAPVTRDEVVAAFDPEDPEYGGWARTAPEIAARVLRARGGNGRTDTRPAVTAHHVKPVLQGLANDGILHTAVGGDVRMIARVPTNLHATATYYVLSTRAAAYRTTYLELLARRRLANDTAAALRETLVGATITGVQARDTMVEVTLTPEQAAALFGIGPGPR